MLSTQLVTPTLHAPVLAPCPADDEPLYVPSGALSQALIVAVLARPRLLATSPDPTPPLWLNSAPEPTGVHAVDGGGALMLDVLLVVLDLLLRGGGAANLSARAVLARKGYQRWGLERQALEARVAARLDLLSRLSVSGPCGLEAILSLSARNAAKTDFLVKAGAPLVGDLDPARSRKLPVSILRLDHRRNRSVDVLAKKIAVAMAVTPHRGPFLAADLADLAPPPAVGRCGEVQVASSSHLVAALARLRALGRYAVSNIEGLERRQRAGLDWRSAQVAIQPVSDRNFLPTRAAVVAEPRIGARRAAALNTAYRPPRPRGRPRFEPLPEHIGLIRALLARGSTRQQIAAAIGISLPTLRRSFAHELRG